jgi:hypothetical protein
VKPFSAADQRKIRDEASQGMSYVVLRNRGGPGIDSIVCLACNSESFSQGDIENQYCGKCHKHHYTPS